MQTYYECIPCFVRQAIEAIQMVTDDKKLQEEALRGVLQKVTEMDFNETPPYMAWTIHRTIRDLVHSEDPYKEIKNRFNRAAMLMYDDIEKMIENSEDHFSAAIKVAIAGNIIDFGVRSDISEEEVRETVDDCLQRDFKFNTAAELKEAVARADKILYLGDNAGEIVFDKHLLKRMPCEKISYVVKGMPVINDATRDDAVDTGLTDMVRVIDNGCDAPGTILKLAAPEFINEYQEADLIIAKGQANYETLSEEKGKEIFFLLKVKCPVIARDLNCEVGEIVLKRNYISG